MKIRIASDLHTEFWPGIVLVDTLSEVLPPLDTDAESVLCLAGDIGLFHRANTWLSILKHLAKRFKAVVFVAGNHEFYHNSYFDQIEMLQKEIKLPDNVHFLENNSIEIEDTVFIGATLWTNMDDWDEMTMRLAHRAMTDYQCMRTGMGHMAQVSDTILKFEESEKYIFDTMVEYMVKSDKPWKQVVLTHHMPSYESVNARFKGDNLNAAFATELGNKIYQCMSPNVWIHGHTHDSCDYMIGTDTQVICNPYGYRAQEVNPKYNKELVIDI